MTTHHDQPLSLSESIGTIDRDVAQRIARWEGSLSRDEFRDRIRTLADSYDDARSWEGTDGNDAAHLQRLMREELEDDRFQ